MPPPFFNLDLFGSIDCFLHEGMAMIHLTFDMVNPPEIVGELTWRHIGFVRETKTFMK